MNKSRNKNTSRTKENSPLHIPTRTLALNLRVLRALEAGRPGGEMNRSKPRITPIPRITGISIKRGPRITRMDANRKAKNSMIDSAKLSECDSPRRVALDQPSAGQKAMRGRIALPSLLRRSGCEGWKHFVRNSLLNSRQFA